MKPYRPLPTGRILLDGMAQAGATMPFRSDINRAIFIMPHHETFGEATPQGHHVAQYCIVHISTDHQHEP